VTPISYDVATSVPSAVTVVGRLVGSDLEAYGPATGLSGDLAAIRGFEGKVGDSFVRAEGDVVEILVGTGEERRFGPTEARRAAATFARALGKAQAAALDLRGAPSEAFSAARLAQAVVEGVGGAAYRFERYRSEKADAVLERIVLLVDEADVDEAAAGAQRGRAVSTAVSMARDLTNTPPGDLTPAQFADHWVAVAESVGAAIVVLDEEHIAEERLGGLLGVARGSAEPPRLVKMTYEPDEALSHYGPDGKVPTVVLVGKGITFDSGGLSLKSPEGMIGMKADMSGAAVALASVSACRDLGVGVRVVGIAPVTENMPGGRAQKPGDVLTIRNGKTIEVLNTDAEGRLVLADGLVLAAEQEPDAIIDLATLTGACVVALGSEVAGLMGNDSHVLGALEEAAARAGESIWRLPLPRGYRKDIDSDIADMKNMGKPRQAGALVAGLLLEEFVNDRPWAHLDIAGPADSDDERYEIRKGGTGFGVRTLLQFLEDFRPVGEVGSRRADHAEAGW
jgi:leucyl aminopeptidase